MPCPTSSVGVPMEGVAPPRHSVLRSHRCASLPDPDFVGMFHGVDDEVPTESLEFGARVLDRFLGHGVSVGYRTLYWPPMTVRRVEYQVSGSGWAATLSRNAVRQLLTDHAEYGGWELTAAALPRWRRDAWIRRKIIRVPART